MDMYNYTKQCLCDLISISSSTNTIICSLPTHNTNEADVSNVHVKEARPAHWTRMTNGFLVKATIRSWHRISRHGKRMQLAIKARPVWLDRTLQLRRKSTGSRPTVPPSAAATRASRSLKRPHLSFALL